MNALYEAERQSRLGGAANGSLGGSEGTLPSPDEEDVGVATVVSAEQAAITAASALASARSAAPSSSGSGGGGDDREESSISSGGGGGGGGGAKVNHLRQLYEMEQQVKELAKEQEARAALPPKDIRDMTDAEIVRHIQEQTHRKLIEKEQKKSAAKGSLAEEREHKFWSTQPMPAFNATIDANANGPIDENTDIERISADPLHMPKGYEWCDLDVMEEGTINELYSLLSKNYVEDDEAMFRFDYSVPFLQWALTPPGYSKTLHVGVRAQKTGKLFGCITGVPALIRVNDKQIEMVCVCVCVCLCLFWVVCLCRVCRVVSCRVCRVCFVCVFCVCVCVCLCVCVLYVVLVLLIFSAQICIIRTLTFTNTNTNTQQTHTTQTNTTHNTQHTTHTHTHTHTNTQGGDQLLMRTQKTSHTATCAGPYTRNHEAR